MGEFARALGDPDGDPDAAAGRAAGHAATPASHLGVEEEHLPVRAVMQHPALGNTPDLPDEEELELP